MKRISINKTNIIFLAMIIFLAGILFLSFFKKEEIQAATWLGSSDNYETNFRDIDGNKVADSNILNTHYISTSKELAGLAYLINTSGYYNNYKSDTFYLIDNIELSNYDWVPIGTASKPFSGKFVGNGRVISGMKITNRQTDAGLFGYVEGNSIENIMVSGSITFNNSSNVNIGGLVGFAKNSTFDKIASSVTISTPSSDYVGGLIGKYQTNITLSSSFVNPGVTIEGRDFVGGLVGGDTDKLQGAAKISNIYNNGKQVKGRNNVGGIVGYIRRTPPTLYSYISYGYNNAIVIASLNYAGGIIGYGNHVSLENLYNYKSVSGGIGVGGISGYTANLSESVITKINGVTNLGNVSGTGNVGGLVAEGKGGLEIRNSNNFGNVTGTGSQVGGIAAFNEAMSYKSSKIEYVYNYGNVKGYQIVGGILSYAGNYSTIVRHAANHGNVTSEAKNDTYSFVGGIVGRQWSGTAGLSLDYTYNRGIIKGKTDMGGLIGYTEISSTEKGSAKIKNSYNTGTITNLGSKNYVGALIGRNYKDRASNSGLHFYSGKSTPNKAFGTGGGGGTNKSNGTANIYTSLSGLKSALSGTYWGKSGTYATVTSISYGRNDNYSNFSSSVWELNADENINSSMPYLKAFYW